jgi:hypothetical protein
MKRSLCLGISPFHMTLMLVIAGCGASSGDPIGPPAPISVEAGTTRTTVRPGATAQFTATVINDTANKGVAWTVSCSPELCGTVSRSTTASDVPTTFTAETFAPADGFTVTITATSVADRSALARISVTIPGTSQSTGRGVVVTPGSGLIPVATTQQFSATIDNDRADAGIDWTLTQAGTLCAPGCGTLAKSRTANGDPVTYTAPQTLPSSHTVMLTAKSVANAKNSSSAVLTITAGTAKLVPNILNLGLALIGQNSWPQTAMLTNTGKRDLKVVGISFIGSNTADFSQSNTCGNGLGAGMSCTVAVTLRPTALGLRSSAVSIADNSSDSPQQALVSGTAHSKVPQLWGATRSFLPDNDTAAVSILECAVITRRLPRHWSARTRWLRRVTRSESVGLQVG